jgi:hypothetical protein
VFLPAKVEYSHPLPELSEAEARQLETASRNPFFLQAAHEEQKTGKFAGLGNPNRLPSAVFMAIHDAWSKWHFKSCMKDGKPQYFHANPSHMQ